MFSVPWGTPLKNPFLKRHNVHSVVTGHKCGIYDPISHYIYIADNKVSTSK
jgi:hypothetical protein